MGFDVIENDIELVLNGHDEPHNIIPVPYYINDKEFQRCINKYIVQPTLIICSDEIYADIIHDGSISKSLLGIYKVSELTTQLLQTQWKELSDVIQKWYTDSKECIIDPQIRLTTYGSMSIS